MLIYCNGDSFTSGHGLGDFLLPNYPGESDDAPDKLPYLEKWTKLRISNAHLYSTLLLFFSRD